MPSHERHAEQFHYSFKKEINELYWAIAIKNFSVALIAFFSPIFVFLFFDQSIPKTLLFYISSIMGQVILVPLTAKLLSRWGVKKLMAIGGPFLGFYFLSLGLANDFGILFMVAAATFKTIYLVLYWPARHVDFAKFANKKRETRQLGFSQIISAVTKVVAPLIGGIIITQVGFMPLFIFASIALVLASVPLFFSPEVFETYSLSYKQSFAQVFRKQNLRTSLSFFFEGAEYGVNIFILPIFVFLIIGSFTTLGWITSVTLFLTMIFTYVIGWSTDKKGGRKVLAITSVFHTISWIIVGFAQTSIQYLIYGSMLRLAETANHLPFMSLWYKRAREQKHFIDEYIVLHEIVHNSGRIVFLGIIALAFSLGFESFFLPFILAALGAFMFRLAK